MHDSDENNKNLLLGQLIQAHKTRSKMRKVAKTAKSTMDNAKELYLHFGKFEDCGADYSDDYEKSKGCLDQAVALKVWAEKSFKKLKKDYEEKYGDLDVTLFS